MLGELEMNGVSHKSWSHGDAGGRKYKCHAVKRSASHQLTKKPRQTLSYPSSLLVESVLRYQDKIIPVI
jgi:hypothetical protein